MRPEQERPPQEQPFWHLDEALTELELQEGPSRPELYTVRLKARTATSPYRARSEIYPLRCDGTEHEVAGKAYILVPDITLAVDLFPTPQPSGAIGRVTDAEWQGMRHHEIAVVRGLYYEDDRAIGLWEVDDLGKLDEFAHGRLWLAFERWLVQRFPQATRIYTDDAEPGENTEQNREILADLGYQPVHGTTRIFAKEVVR